MSGPEQPRGCGGAVTKMYGKGSEAYCVGNGYSSSGAVIEEKYPWWGNCCAFDHETQKCFPKRDGIKFSCDLQANMDAPGNDLIWCADNGICDHYGKEVEAIDVCQKKCEKRTSCAAYAYKTSQKLCWLKSMAGKLVPSDDNDVAICSRWLPGAGAVVVHGSSDRSWQGFQSLCTMASKRLCYVVRRNM